MYRKIAAVFCLSLLGALPLGAGAEVERFLPAQGGEVEVWRLTNNPAERFHANYHNVQCWSPDGRYVCYYGRGRVHVVDLQDGSDREVARGDSPRWAYGQNWLVYINGDNGVDRYDADMGAILHITDQHFTQLGGTDYRDDWVFGGSRAVDRGRPQGYRVALHENAQADKLEGLTGIQWVPNPAHPIVFVRNDSFDDTVNDRPAYLLQSPTRIWFDLEGKNLTTGSPQFQRCHQSWRGDGEYLLHGNYPMRGRKWNEPYPSNMNILANIGCGDISPCGRSGRWICGSGFYGPLQVADMRSGDGWDFLGAALSMIHDLPDKSFSSGSALHDNDIKGSPDGTKVCFSSNYDLRDGPVAQVMGPLRDGTLPVSTTERFPDRGYLSTGPNCIASYQSKTPTAFEGVERLEVTGRAPSLEPGSYVTSLEARCVAWKDGDLAASLARQRQTDVYIAVIRKPDAPFLRERDGRLEAVPGENHFETAGYHVLRDGERITTAPLAPNSSMDLGKAGAYAVVAVEWSGLESEPSAEVEIAKGTTLHALAETPVGFSWTRDVWRPEGVMREIVHRNEGVIHREWYKDGKIARRHDLNRGGRATRRFTYVDGLLVRREYFDPEGQQTSFELFDRDGNITESVAYRGDEVYCHFWWNRGVPLKHVGRDSHHEEKPGPHVNRDGRWVPMK